MTHIDVCASASARSLSSTYCPNEPWPPPLFCVSGDPRTGRVDSGRGETLRQRRSSAPRRSRAALARGADEPARPCDRRGDRPRVRPRRAVPLRVYDETIRVLRRAVDAARLSNDDRLAAIRSLDAEARQLERTAEGPSFDDFVDAERARSRQLGGGTVLDPDGAVARHRSVDAGPSASSAASTRSDRERIGPASMASPARHPTRDDS